MTIERVQRMSEVMPFQWNRIKGEIIEVIKSAEIEPAHEQLNDLRLKVAHLRIIFDRSMLLIQQVHEDYQTSKMTDRKLLVLSMAETITFIVGIVAGGYTVKKSCEEQTTWLQTSLFASFLMASHLLSKGKDILTMRKIDEEKSFALSTECRKFLVSEQKFLRALEEGLMGRSEDLSDPLPVIWQEKKALLLYLGKKEQEEFGLERINRSLEELHLLA